MDAETWIGLGALLIACLGLIVRAWQILNRRIDDVRTEQAKLRLDVQKEFASVGHFDKLEGKLDKLIEKVEKLGLALASHSRASTRSHNRASDPR